MNCFFCKNKINLVSVSSFLSPNNQWQSANCFNCNCSHSFYKNNIRSVQLYYSTSSYQYRVNFQPNTKSCFIEFLKNNKNIESWNKLTDLPSDIINLSVEEIHKKINNLMLFL